jgi:phosphoribosylformylglycinamidine synthase PurS subunit
VNALKPITLNTALPNMVKIWLSGTCPLVSIRVPSIGNPRQATQVSAMKTRVFVTLKNGVLDPQGKAIHHAIENLGFSGVNDVRAGRLFEIEHEPGLSTTDIETMCTKLLANMVIENFEIEQAV